MTAPISRVDLSDSPVCDSSDFHKVSKAEMEEGFRKLQSEVRPAVARGADGETFTRMDQERGLEPANGYRKIYDAFYGNDSIRLDKVGDQYTVVNGYHRLAVAREMGIPDLPARVIEKRT